MATTQYIGARYVPLFYTAPDGSNNWIAGVAYDPLTVVTDLNQAYTSKIPVPATVGRPSENPTYWILTGAYSAQVEEYRQQVEAYALEVDTLEERVGHKYLFVGDSFDAMYDIGWSDILAEDLKLSAENYYTIRQGGAGLAPSDSNKSYENLIRNNRAIPSDIDTIIIGGGTNDANASFDTLLNAATALKSYLTTRFPKLQRVYLSYMCVWFQSVQTWRASNNGCRYYANICESLGWIFTAGVESVLMDPTLISATDTGKVHPSLDGLRALGHSLYQSIRGGYAKVFYDKTVNVTVNPALGHAQATRAVSVKVFQNTIDIYQNVVSCSGSESAISGFVDLYTFPDMSAPLPVDIYQPVIITYGKNNQLMGNVVAADLNTIRLYIAGGSIPANTSFTIGPWHLHQTYR